jgi:hypothetical protein
VIAFAVISFFFVGLLFGSGDANKVPDLTATLGYSFGVALRYGLFVGLAAVLLAPVYTDPRWHLSNPGLTKPISLVAGILISIVVGFVAGLAVGYFGMR